MRLGDSTAILGREGLREREEKRCQKPLYI
jgi:hypothetical protein